ncbi:MAG: glycosyltransferase family 4 protein [Nitrospinota bacterium]
MKVAQLASVGLAVPPADVGANELLLHLVTEGLARRGHQVTLFAAGDSRVSTSLEAIIPRSTRDTPGMTIYLEKEYEGRNAWNLYRRGDEFDVIHAHWPTLAPYFTPWTSTPTVITYGYIEPHLHAFYRAHFPRLHPVCVSRAQARMLGEESLPVIYNGVDTSSIPFGAESEGFVIYAGRMVPNKGVAEAIEVARRAGERLLLVGQEDRYLPWSREYFEREVRLRVDGERVRWVPALPNAELMKLFGRARAFLFPVQWEEPFGLTVVESMAAGAPVVTLRRGSMPELVRDGETGFVLDRVEDMVEALRRAADLDRRACRRRVEENFSAERMVEGYESFYRKLI